MVSTGIISYKNIIVKRKERKIMKKIFNLVQNKAELEEELQNLKHNSITMIEKALTEKFELLAKILFPYKEIMTEMDISSKVILLRSEQLDRTIKIKIDTREKFWLQISFNMNSYFYLMPDHIDQTYWIEYPVLQEINLETVVSEFRKGIIYELKMINKNLSTQINQIKTSLNACNIENDVKLLESMLNDLFELNNQYIASNDEKLIPFISNIITAMEETLTFKEG